MLTPPSTVVSPACRDAMELFERMSGMTVQDTNRAAFIAGWNAGLNDYPNNPYQGNAAGMFAAGAQARRQHG